MGKDGKRIAMIPPRERPARWRLPRVTLRGRLQERAPLVLSPVPSGMVEVNPPRRNDDDVILKHVSTDHNADRKIPTYGTTFFDETALSIEIGKRT